MHTILLSHLLLYTPIYTPIYPYLPYIGHYNLTSVDVEEAASRLGEFFFVGMYVYVYVSMCVYVCIQQTGTILLRRYVPLYTYSYTHYTRSITLFLYTTYNTYITLSFYTLLFYTLSIPPIPSYTLLYLLRRIRAVHQIYHSLPSSSQSQHSTQWCGDIPTTQFRRLRQTLPARGIYLIYLTYTHTNTYIYIHIHTYIHIYIHTYTHIHTHT
jgi:hypothetical protein